MYTQQNAGGNYTANQLTGLCVLLILAVNKLYFTWALPWHLVTTLVVVGRIYVFSSRPSAGFFHASLEYFRW